MMSKIVLVIVYPSDISDVRTDLSDFSEQLTDNH